MFDVKRVAYILILALAWGLLLVYFQTAHFQCVYQTSRLQQQQQQIRRQIAGQQVLISYRIENPEQIRNRVAQLGLRVHPPGQIGEVPGPDVNLARAAAAAATDQRPLAD